jgi:hypothetical protein
MKIITFGTFYVNLTNIHVDGFTFDDEGQSFENEEERRLASMRCLLEHITHKIEEGIKNRNYKVVERE